MNRQVNEFGAPGTVRLAATMENARDLLCMAKAGSAIACVQTRVAASETAKREDLCPGVYRFWLSIAALLSVNSSEDGWPAQSGLGGARGTRPRALSLGLPDVAAQQGSA